MAHETFHCISHVPRLQTFISGTDLGTDVLPRALRSELRPFEDPELQAWKFAQMIMMPEPVIKKFMREGKNERWMADYFDVNPAFLRVRLGCKTLR
jgi:Zn-dependent peptidase ImmA (M78 family)